jgi:hypothetical protein
MRLRAIANCDVHGNIALPPNEISDRYDVAPIQIGKLFSSESLTVLSHKIYQNEIVILIAPSLIRMTADAISAQCYRCVSLPYQVWALTLGLTHECSHYVHFGPHDVVWKRSLYSRE